MEPPEIIEAWLFDPVSHGSALLSMPEVDLATALVEPRLFRVIVGDSFYVLDRSLGAKSWEWLPGLDALSRFQGSPLPGAMIALAQERRPELVEPWSRPRPWGPDAPWLAQHFRIWIDHDPIGAASVRRLAAWAPPESLIAKVLFQNLLEWTRFGGKDSFRTFSIRPLEAALPCMTPDDAWRAFVALFDSCATGDYKDRQRRLDAIRSFGPTLVEQMGPVLAAHLLPLFLVVASETNQLPDMMPDTHAQGGAMRIFLCAYQIDRRQLNPKYHEIESQWWPFLDALLDIVLPHGADAATPWARKIMETTPSLASRAQRLLAAASTPSRDGT